MNDGLTASDVALLQNGNGNNGMWGDGAWWIVLFLIFGWGRNGFGGGYGGDGSGAYQNYVLNSDFATLQRIIDSGFQGVEKGIDTIRTGLCDGFYTEAQLINSVNTNIMQGTNTIQTQLADCCCKTQSGIKDVQYAVATTGAGIERGIESGFAQTNYNMATQNCATLQAIDKVGDRVIDYLANEKLQNLRDENFALRLSASQSAQNQYLVNELRPCPIPAYITCNPFAQTNYVNGCGCGVN